MSLFDMTGQVALITGSSRGIGRAIAEEMAAQGAKVVLSSRSQDSCDKAAAEIEARHGAGCTFSMAANIGSKEELQQLVDQTLDRFGKITALVCNAAISPYSGPASDIPDNLFRKILDYNILSTQWLATMVSTQMIECGDGSITIVSSIAGLSGSANMSAYSISKAGDIQLTKNLAVELGRNGIRVNCIAPGPIETFMTQGLIKSPDFARKTIAATCLKRMGRPEDIAGAAIFFASAAGRFTTGQTLACDGGSTVVGLG
tara:strand:- start:5774 stop:6550 length:777 start_codon:yes stop_codon:yes gene_type:complete